LFLNYKTSGRQDTGQLAPGNVPRICISIVAPEKSISDRLEIRLAVREADTLVLYTTAGSCRNGIFPKSCFLRLSELGHGRDEAAVHASGGAGPWNAEGIK
jgi:hypothetical protein